jgi:hypothetical protein
MEWSLTCQMPYLLVSGGGDEVVRVGPLEQAGGILTACLALRHRWRGMQALLKERQGQKTGRGRRLHGLRGESRRWKRSLQ